MTFYAIMTIALALSLDAFAVAVASGIELRGGMTGRQRFRLSFHFGLFQFLMPVIGWFLGLTVRDLIASWDHWVAFVLLALVGGNMIRSFFAKDDGGEEESPHDPTKGFSLIMLSVATSIDALAVGLSFSVLKMSVWFPAAVIGLTCGVVTLIGLYLGTTLSKARMFGKRAELVGGLVLIGIGIKVLYEHGVFGIS